MSTTLSTIPTRAPHVIMADDEEDILDLLSHVLTRNGYTVATTTDGNSLADLIKMHHPDIILLDVHMGASDGSELCKKLKGTAATRDIPVIMVSSDSNLDQIAGHCSANGYVFKPVDIDDLLDMMRNVRKPIN